jgi:hypothetical protein
VTLLRLTDLRGVASFQLKDVQTHFVRDDFDHKELLDLGKFASEHWNPKMKDEGVSSLARYKFQNYVKEILRQRHQPGASERCAVRRPELVAPVQRADRQSA